MELDGVVMVAALVMAMAWPPLPACPPLGLASFLALVARSIRNIPKPSKTLRRDLFDLVGYFSLAGPRGEAHMVQVDQHRRTRGCLGGHARGETTWSKVFPLGMR